MRICGVIVAGGRSSRMGSEKAFRTVRGRSILDRILASIGSQVDAVVVNANGDVMRFGAAGIQVIRDIHQEAGTPLAGLHAALHFAATQGFDAALTVPSDTPFLPSDLAARLASSGREAAIVSSGGQAHYLTGLWASGLRAAAESAVLQVRPARLQDWAGQCEAAVIEWPVAPYDPFFNVNTPDDLAEAEQIAAKFSL